MLATSAQAQQTMMGWSLSDLCEAGDASGNTEAVAAICDRNDMTALKVDDIGSAYSIFYTASEPIVVKGVNLVAADDLDRSPSRAILYAYDEGSGEWVVVNRMNSLSFSSPYTSVQSRSLNNQSAPRTRFRLDILKTKTGSALTLAEVQLLGYRAADACNLATAGNGVFGGPDGIDNIGALSGDNPLDIVSLRNVKADYGIENAWIDYEFTTPTAISAYSLTTPAATLSAKFPRTWELQASNDGDSWVTLDMRSNEGSLGIDNVTTLYSLPNAGFEIDFAAVADELYKVADEKFMRNHGGGKYLIHAWNVDPELENLGFNYWWMAHAVDAYIDAYNRTGKMTYQTKARQIKAGMYGGGSSLWNTFYDDMEWMCLACIRAYEAGFIEKDTWLDEAKQLYDWIWAGWTDVKGGGISWNSGSGVDSKNACANAPAIICAAKLYKLTGEQRYLDNALKIYDWMVNYCLFDDGFVKDGCDNETRSWAFTYNQGTWVGGLMHLYDITKEQKYYDIATDLIDKTLSDRWYSPDGIMREQGSSDGGLFKGIYVRYICDWVRSGLLDSERQYRYAQFLMENARSMYMTSLKKPDYTVMPCWKSRESVYNGENNGGDNGSYHASILLSGMFLCEAADAMRRDGILDDNYAVKNVNIGKEFKNYRIVFSSNWGGNDLQLNKFTLDGEEAAASVGGISAAGNKAKVSVCNGSIIIESADALPVGVYAVTGERIAECTAPAKVDCVKGFYIVKAGDYAAKVAVR